MAEDPVIYQEMWPWGRLIHLRLTAHTFTTSLYKSFFPLTTIPLTTIRRVEIGRLGFSKMMHISYYGNATTFRTASFPVSNRDAWRRAFQTLGIIPD
jgi:hypothetical protein